LRLSAASAATKSGIEHEAAVRDALRAGDVVRATTEALNAYGAELFGFVVGVLDDYDAARDVYAAISERVWRALAEFSWRCSLRTWVYTIARNELARHHERAGRQRARNVPLSAVPSPAVRARTTTRPFVRTTLRAAFSELRRELSAEDRELLVLRVDRGMAWRDLALTFLGEGAEEGDVLRESTRLRKRLQLVKEKLTRAAASRGILPPR
jgi:RNA polymerase sigma-70 factor (ECF subfamily)